MDKKKSVLLILIVGVLLIAIGRLAFNVLTKNNLLSSNVGNVSKAEVTIKNTGEHSKKDIEEVIDLFKKYFKTNGWKDCTLLKVSYDIDKKLEDEIKNNNKYDEVIIFTIEFKTGDKPIMPLASNYDYNYSVEYSKTENGKWTLTNLGV